MVYVDYISFYSGGHGSHIINIFIINLYFYISYNKKGKVFCLEVKISENDGLQGLYLSMLLYGFLLAYKMFFLLLLCQARENKT